jgi:hypothetical protein
LWSFITHNLRAKPVFYSRSLSIRATHSERSYLEAELLGAHYTAYISALDDPPAAAVSFTQTFLEIPEKPPVSWR